jgi:hypothetical protein
MQGAPPFGYQCDSAQGGWTIPEVGTSNPRAVPEQQGIDPVELGK